MGAKDEFSRIGFRGFPPRSLGYFLCEQKVTKKSLKPVGRPQAAAQLPAC